MSPQTHWLECAQRLGELQRSADCAVHCLETMIPGQNTRWMSVYSNCTTGEVFVEVSDDRITRVQSFQSRHKSCSAEERRKDLPLVDVADAHALARTLICRW